MLLLPWSGVETESPQWEHCYIVGISEDVPRHTLWGWSVMGSPNLCQEECNSVILKSSDGYVA